MAKFSYAWNNPSSTIPCVDSGRILHFTCSVSFSSLNVLSLWLLMKKKPCPVFSWVIVGIKLYIHYPVQLNSLAGRVVVRSLCTQPSHIPWCCRFSTLGIDLLNSNNCINQEFNKFYGYLHWWEQTPGWEDVCKGFEDQQFETKTSLFVSGGRGEDDGWHALVSETWYLV